MEVIYLCCRHKEEVSRNAAERHFTAKSRRREVPQSKIEVIFAVLFFAVEFTFYEGVKSPTILLNRLKSLKMW